MVQAIPICRLESFAVHFGDELRAGDHLRYCTGALSAVLVTFAAVFPDPTVRPWGSCLQFLATLEENYVQMRWPLKAQITRRMVSN